LLQITLPVAQTHSVFPFTATWRIPERPKAIRHTIKFKKAIILEQLVTIVVGEHCCGSVREWQHENIFSYVERECMRTE
jgi:hypothetical protein